MTIRSFELLEPRSLVEAVDMLAKHGDDARAIGGGTTLVILMKQRAVYYPFLVDLQAIGGLNHISQENGAVRIGALATHHDVECSALIRNSLPVLADAFSKIGNVRVRRTASVGGNLAHADYRLDPPPPLLVLGAEVTAIGPKGSRIIPLRDFFRGLYETALESGELISEVRVPAMPEGSKAVYLRYSALSANDWPCLSVAALAREEKGRCQELRLALGGVAATPVLVKGLDFVRDQPLGESLAEKLLQTVDEQIAPVSDLRGSEWYKRQMVRVFVKKAVAQLASRAT